MDRGNRFDDGYGGGFSNEDRRGFALPERQMYSNDMGGNGGLFDRGQMDDRRNNGGGSGMRSQFERRSMGGGGGGGMDNGMNDMMFSRRGM